MSSLLKARMIGIAVVAAAIGWVPGWQGTARPASTQPAMPNIVLFLTDDQRHDTLEYMPIVQRELLGRGINFTNAYATTPLCCPSRASILTGRYAHHHGVLTNSGPQGGWRKFDDSSTLATWMQAAGMRTMLLGKYLNLYASLKVPPGWSEWFALWDKGKERKYYDYTVNQNGNVLQYGDRENEYSTDTLAREANNLLRADNGQPFFLYLSFHGPHSPAKPAKRDRGTFDDLPPQRLPSYNEEDVSDKPAWVQRLPLLTPDQQQAHDRFRRHQIETLQAIDRAVGSVIDTLRADGRLDSTWFVFMSDNGFSLGEHRLAEGKTCGYEECVRIPLVIAPPPGRMSEFGAPRIDQRLMLNIDLAPTLAELAGAVPDQVIDGVSIVPFLADPRSAWRTEGMLELWANDDDIAFQGVRVDGWKYLRYENGEQELYDLDADPFELSNLAASPDHMARLAELVARLEALTR